MDPLIAGTIALLAMIALTFLGVPIAYALVGVAVVGNVLLVGWQQTAMQTFLITWEMGTNFLLIAVPLFVFVGQLAFHTRIAPTCTTACTSGSGDCPEASPSPPPSPRRPLAPSPVPAWPRWLPWGRW